MTVDIPYIAHTSMGFGSFGVASGEDYARFCPRVRFNWGFHEALAQFGRNRARTVDPRLPGSMDHVGSTVEHFYAMGYVAGLVYAFTGRKDATDSTRAWEEYLRTPSLPAAEWDLVFRFVDRSCVPGDIPASAYA